MTTEPEDTFEDDIQDDTERYEQASEERFGGEEEEEAGEEKANPWDSDENPYKAQATDKSKALAAERRKRQEQERRAKALEERLEALEAASKRRPSVDEEIPDEDEDPIGAIKALKKRLEDAEREKEEAKTRQSSASKEQRAAQEFGNKLAEMESEFKADTPDYDKAASHFADSLRAELEEKGYEGDELDRAFGEELIKLSRRAIDNGRNPAEVIYKLAQKRGYTLDKAKQKLQTLASSKAASRSLSKAPSSPPSKELTWSYVASLKGPERDKAWAKLRDQERRRSA